MNFTEAQKEARRKFVARYRAKAIRRFLFKRHSVDQGIQAKARLVSKGKGKNGNSMSAELLARHFATLISP